VFMRKVVRFSSNEHVAECCSTFVPRRQRASRLPSALRGSLLPLRRSRSGGQACRRCEAVRSKARAGHPSFGGRLTTELRHQRQISALSTWQRLYRSRGILLKDRPRRSAFPAFVQQPASNLGLPNPALQPTCYGGLRQPTQAAERQR
jgi:hypothetical protein